MAKIAIKKSRYIPAPFAGEEYVIETNRKFGGYKSGDLICKVSPFPEIPLELEIAIRKDGDIIFRSWNWLKTEGNPYLHCNLDTSDMSGFTPTEEQGDTIAGLFSGRIKFERLKLSVGASLQKLCPIDVNAEQAKAGKNIYLS